MVNIWFCNTIFLVDFSKWCTTIRACYHPSRKTYIFNVLSRHTGACRKELIQKNYNNVEFTTIETVHEYLIVLRAENCNPNILSMTPQILLPICFKQFYRNFPNINAEQFLFIYLHDHDHDPMRGKITGMVTIIDQKYIFLWIINEVLILTKNWHGHTLGYNSCIGCEKNVRWAYRCGLFGPNWFLFGASITTDYKTAR